MSSFLLPLDYLVERYNKSSDEILRIIKENFHNFDGKLLPNKSFTINCDAVEILDEIVGYQGEPFSLVDKAKEQSYLNQINDLKTAVQDGNVKLKEKNEEITFLQEQLFNIQQQNESVNSAVLKKYQSRAEQLEQKLKAAEAASAKRLADREKRIKELESLNSELVQKNEENAEANKNRLTAEIKYMEAQKEVRSYLQKISDADVEVTRLRVEKEQCELKIASLMSELSTARSDVRIVDKEISKLSLMLRNIYNVAEMQSVNIQQEIEVAPELNSTKYEESVKMIEEELAKSEPKDTSFMSSADSLSHEIPREQPQITSQDVDDFPDYDEEPAPSATLTKPTKPSKIAMRQEELMEQFGSGKPTGESGGVLGKLKGFFGIF